MSNEAGKGDTYRQVVWDKYSENYDKVFGKAKVKVSGVPYEVDLPDVVAELERENFMLRARVQRLEEELDNALGKR